MRVALDVVCVCALLSVPLPADSQLSGIGAESRLQTVRSLIDTGRYAEAELEADGLLSTLEKAQEVTPGHSLQAIDLLVEALVCNGKGAEARTRALAQQAIRDKEAGAGSNHLILTPSLRNLGDVLIEAGEYQAAKVVYERGLAIRSLAVGTNHPDVADELDRLVRAFTLVEQYDDALMESDRALRIRENVLDRADARTARTLEVRGLLLQRRGDYSSARLALERALRLRESANPGHPRIAETLRLLGEQRWFEGDLVGAKQFGEKALAFAENTLRPGHPDIAVYLMSLSTSVADSGDLAGARALRERALTIAEKALGADHPLVALQLNELAISFFMEGDYLRARALYTRALTAYEHRLGPDHSWVTTEVYNLALVNHLLGDFLEARRQFNRAITTWERVVGRDHVYVARAVSALAEMLSEQGLDAQARVLYERALAIRERALGKDHPDVAQILTLMSTTVARLGQVGQAYELSTRALRILEQPSAGETRRVAEALRVHGTLQASQGDYVGARASYDRALLALRRIVGGSHPDVATVRLSMAATFANMHQASEALRNALEAEEIGRGHLRLMLRYLPERQGLEYAAKRPKGLDFALSLATVNTDTDGGARIFDGLIRSRSLVLDEMAQRRRVSADAERLDLAPSWAALVSARQRFANLVFRGPDQRHLEKYDGLLDEARREKEQAERAVAEKSVAFRDELSRGEIGLDEVRAALPSNGVLVAIARYDRMRLDPREPAARPSMPAALRVQKPVPSYVAFILRVGDPNVTAVPLGPASSIDALVAAWRNETSNVLRTSSASDAEKSYRSAGAALRRRVWDPLGEHLKGAQTVFVVPDGTLNLVSLAALPVGQTKYLIDDGPVIHYLSAERDLVVGERPSAASRGLLAVGGAAFDDVSSFSRGLLASTTGAPLGTAGGTSSAVATLRALPGDRLAASCGTFQSLRFQPLAGTRQEVREIARLWAGSPAQVLESRDASERTFKREAPGHRVLHLATHGFFLGSCSTSGSGTRSVGGLATQPKNQPKPGVGESPLLMSGLALAGANRRAAAGPDDEDGILTAEEVSALNLEGVEWAVLSACDTGLGEVKIGEGVFGLRRAFQVAGARTVIMSLWSVQDQAAGQWMRALYQGRLQRHLDTAGAMRYASLNVLRDRRAKGQSTHPFYWAGFVAAGDWR